jgi:hypothetical protein
MADINLNQSALRFFILGARARFTIHRQARGGAGGGIAAAGGAGPASADFRF